jgi:hypothetical protein
VVVDVEQGGLILRDAACRLVLLDSEGIAVDVRQLRPDELIRYGDELEFPFYAAIVGQNGAARGGKWSRKNKERRGTPEPQVRARPSDGNGDIPASSVGG